MKNLITKEELDIMTKQMYSLLSKSRKKMIQKTSGNHNIIIYLYLN